MDVPRSMQVLTFSHSSPVQLGFKIGSCLIDRGAPTRNFRASKRSRAQVTSTASAISSREVGAPANPKCDLSELHLYNTLHKCKEQFTTVEPNVVKFYSCGPTVYDYAHIGNFRAFLTYDVVKRWLRRIGYKVDHVMNLTDVDDKIIARARELGCTLRELTDKYADAFFSDLKLLNVIPANHYPRATEYMSDIEDVVVALREKGVAYERDGSTYFSVKAFPRYGQLVELDRRIPNSGNADDADEYEKSDARDFALWKAWKPEDGNVKWESDRLGPGRPGWHIECSCMAMKLLGPQLDIHGGGVDLAFPHHENEIAQSEAYSGACFSRFWLHNGFVNIGNEKMSKSLRNFRTLRDIVKEPIDARAFRYLVATSQYRSPLAFTDICLDAARKAVCRIDLLRMRLDDVIEAKTQFGDDAQISNVTNQARQDFVSAMNDDLNTPRAAGAMFKVVNVAEKMIKEGQMSGIGAKIARFCLDEFDAVFGINYIPEFEEEDEEVPSEVWQLLEKRNNARVAKNYQLADNLRDQINSRGYNIVDTSTGAILEKKK